MRKLMLAAAVLATSLRGAAPHVVFVTGDDEYRSEHSMPMLGRILEKKYGMKVSVAYAKPTPQSNKNIEGLDALATADLAVFFLRWRELPGEQIGKIVAYLESGKPLVGLRTSTHSFKFPEGHKYAYLNDTFPYEAFGQKWIRHHGHTSTTAVSVVEEQKKHAVLRGVAAPFAAPSWLYVVEPLAPGSTRLLMGRAIRPEKQDAGPQAVAWTRSYKGARVFFTTLGHSEDLKIEAVRRLVLNGILWALGKDVPEGGADAGYVGEYDPPPSGFPKQ